MSRERRGATGSPQASGVERGEGPRDYDEPRAHACPLHVRRRRSRRAPIELSRDSRFPSRQSGRPPAAPGIIGVVKANAYGHGAPAVGLALQEAGATILACADIEEAIVLREAGVTAEVLIFGALGVSDIEGVFEYGLTPTISTPGAGRSLQAAAAARRQSELPSQDRHRDEPARVSSRQPRVHAARAGREPQPRHHGGLHALRDGRRSRLPAFSEAARAFRARPRAPSAARCQAACVTRPTAQPRFATRASGSTSCVRA